MIQPKKTARYVECPPNRSWGSQIKIFVLEHRSTLQSWYNITSYATRNSCRTTKNLCCAIKIITYSCFQLVARRYLNARNIPSSHWKNCPFSVIWRNCHLSGVLWRKHSKFNHQNGWYGECTGDSVQSDLFYGDLMVK